MVADITGPIATAIYRFPTDHNLTIWFDDIVDFENDFNRVYFNLYVNYELYFMFTGVFLCYIVAIFHTE